MIILKDIQIHLVLLTSALCEVFKYEVISGLVGLNTERYEVSLSHSHCIMREFLYFLKEQWRKASIGEENFFFLKPKKIILIKL